MDYRELQSALKSKGNTSENREGHHIFYFVEVDGKEYRATKVSHSARGQIDDNILSQIARQMRLTTKELRNFVACLIDREKWLQLWSQRGHTWRLRG